MCHCNRRLLNPKKLASLASNTIWRPLSTSEAAEVEREPSMRAQHDSFIFHGTAADLTFVSDVGEQVA